MKKKLIDDIIEEAYITINKPDGCHLRLGQVFFNLLNEYHPDIANEIKETKLDCFYKRKLDPELIEFVTKKIKINEDFKKKINNNIYQSVSNSRISTFCNTSSSTVLVKESKELLQYYKAIFNRRRNDGFRSSRR
jgi:hypothetical protein